MFERSIVSSLHTMDAAMTIPRTFRLLCPRSYALRFNVNVLSIFPWTREGRYRYRLDLSSFFSSFSYYFDQLLDFSSRKNRGCRDTCYQYRVERISLSCNLLFFTMHRCYVHMYYFFSKYDDKIFSKQVIS